MNNIPKMKIGIVAVSRDCFPESLSVNRRKALVDAYAAKYDAADIYECPVCIVESEIHMVQALEDIKAAGCNALCVYLGNFGPEISETLLAKHFDGPKMFVAAAEETQENLIQGRGDAYCGMLNASYNLKLRNVGAYIPEYPVGDAEDCADMIHDFLPIARAVEGLANLKIISAHREPDVFFEYAKSAEEKGFKVIIAGAGMAAHLPGMCAAIFPMPVIGIPMHTTSLGGRDSLYSIVQMPTGIPVATVAINGGANAGILAAKILATSDADLLARLKEYSKNLKEQVEAKDARLQEVGYKNY